MFGSGNPPVIARIHLRKSLGKKSVQTDRTKDCVGDVAEFGDSDWAKWPIPQKVPDRCVRATDTSSPTAR